MHEHPDQSAQPHLRTSLLGLPRDTMFRLYKHAFGTHLSRGNVSCQTPIIAIFFFFFFFFFFFIAAENSSYHLFDEGFHLF